MQRPTRLSVVLLCCLGCTGRNGCAANGRRSTNGAHESSNSGEPILTPVDDNYNPCSTPPTSPAEPAAASPSVACKSPRRPCGAADPRPSANSWMNWHRVRIRTASRPRPSCVRSTFAAPTRAPESRSSRAPRARRRGLPNRGPSRAGAGARHSGSERHLRRAGRAEPVQGCRRSRRALRGARRAHHLRSFRARPTPTMVDCSPRSERIGRRLQRSPVGIAPSDVEGALRVDRWLAAAEAPDLSRRDEHRSPAPGLPVETGEGSVSLARLPGRTRTAFRGVDPARGPRHPRPHRRSRAASPDQSQEPPQGADRRAPGGIRRTARPRRGDTISPRNRRRGRTRGVRPSSACSYVVSRDFSPWIDEAYLASLPAAATEPTRELFDLLRDHLARTVAGATWLDDGTRRTAAAKVSGVALRFVADPDTRTGRRRPATGLVPGRGLAAPSEHGGALPRADRSPGRTNVSSARRLRRRVLALSVNSVWLSAEYARDPWIQRRPFSAVNFGALGPLLGHELGHALGVAGREHSMTPGSGAKPGRRKQSPRSSRERSVWKSSSARWTSAPSGRSTPTEHSMRTCPSWSAYNSPSRRWMRTPARRTSTRETTGAASSSSPTRGALRNARRSRPSPERR